GDGGGGHDWPGGEPGFRRRGRGVVGADFSVKRAASPEPVRPRGRLTYSLVATNNGPDRASGVTVEDALPAGIEVVSVKPSQGACAGKAKVTCRLGALATGALAKVAIVIRLRRVGGIANAASVTARQPDPDVRNN